MASPVTAGPEAGDINVTVIDDGNKKYSPALGDEWAKNVIPMPLRTTLICSIVFGIILSNVLNMIVLRMTKQIPAIARTCLLNLSLADMSVGVVSCLPCIYPAITGVWPYGDVFCQIAAITHGVSVTMSIWSLALISVDRYIAIVYPLRYHVFMTQTRCRVIICCMWVFASVTFFIPLPTKPNFVYYQFSPSEVMCGLYWEYPWFCVVTAVYIPILAGTTLAITTWRIVRTVLGMAQTVAPADASGGSGGKKGEVSKSDIKAVKVLVITAVIYFTMWGPYVSEVVVISFVPSLSVPSVVRFATIWMANSNSFMNVIIYSVLYKGFRRNCVWIFKFAFAKVFCMQVPERPADTAD